MDLEATAIEQKERRTQMLRDDTALSAAYVQDKTARELAGLWGTSANEINTLAEMFHRISPEDMDASEPLSLYRAAMGCAK